MTVIRSSDHIRQEKLFPVMKRTSDSVPAFPGHTGSDPGVSARGAFSPDTDSSIVILTNEDSRAFLAFRHLVEWIAGIQKAKC
jgi:hypothetical protein